MSYKSYLLLEDIKRCKKLEPIMQSKNIEPDDLCQYAAHPILPCWVLWSLAEPEDKVFAEGSPVGTYTQGTLEEALPSWVYKALVATAETETLNSSYFYNEIPLEQRARNSGELRPLIKQIWALLVKMFISRGQVKLEATADLIILLEEKGLL